MRTAAQTETALFWNANAVLQYQVALREQVTRRGLGIVESARAFAMLGTATGDSLIACWRGKHDYAYWRPITAIRMADTDGNPRTLPDRAWTPLIPNPPYPDYPSGHACVTGAMTGTVAHLFGTSSLGLSVSSSVTGTSRSYDSTTALDRKTMDARIWLGIHFRRAMADGNELGHDVADWVARHYFEPDDHHGDHDDDHGGVDG